MTTEESTQENQDQDPQELLHQMEETAWRQGQPGLEFFFTYLMVEIKFPNNNDDSTWELNTRGLDIDALRKAIQREQDMMQQVLQSDSFPWVKFGMETKLVNAAEVQEYPYNFADLIFVSLSLPAWVMPPQRPKLLAKLRNILVLYRNNNPDAIIVSITKHAPFRLKDRLSYQWGELSRELGGIGNKGAITRLVAHQLASTSILQTYLDGEHTTQKIRNQTRIQDLQNHLEALQYGQTSMRLIVCIENQLHDTYARRINAVLRNNKFSKFIEKAINFEIDRQTKLLENGESVVQETRLYDSEKNETRSMRSKEEANDYRYFPCPDLLPVVISDKELIEIKENLPELPEEKEKRYVEDIGLDKSEAVIISSSKAMANMFEEASAKTNDAKLVAKWLVGDVSALLNKDNIEIDESKLSAENFGKLIERITDNTISGKIAKSVLEDIWENGSDVDKVIETKGLVQIQDESILEDIAQKVIQSNPDQVSAYLNGKDKLFGFFVGQVMKETQGKANPKSVNDILRRLLK